MAGSQQAREFAQPRGPRGGDWQRHVPSGQRRARDADGARMYFSFHPGGAGQVISKCVIWGASGGAACLALLV